jgi:hypothetical protein
MDTLVFHPPRGSTFLTRTFLRRASRAVLLALTAAAVCSLLPGCASKKSASPEAVNRCPANRPGCQIEVVFTNVGLGERVARLSGRLSAAQPNASYAFDAASGETLRLKLSGAPANLVLTRPNGQASGPGLPAQMVLNAKGKYVLLVVADDGYGDYQLEVRLTEKP